MWNRDEVDTPVKPRCGVQTEAGRGNQMNAGAAIATGDILLFLHSDTQLPHSFIDDIHTVLQQPRAIAGAFPLHIDHQTRERW